MPEATFNHRAQVALSPAQVWARLQDAETWAGLAFIEEVSNAETADGTLARFEFVARAGGQSADGKAVVTANEETELMALDIDAEQIEGSLICRMTAEGKATALEVELTARPTGTMVRMFWGQISAAVERGFAEQVNAFAASLS